MDITLAQLRSFVVVAEELHFRKAAERLGQSQPPLSRMITMLERRVGAQLLVRDSRHVVLTPAGRVFLANAKDILDHLERAINEAQDVHTGGVASLRIGYLESMGHRMLDRLVDVWRAVAALSALEFRELHTQQQIDALHNREIDMGIMRQTAITEGGLEFEGAYDEPVSIAFPTGHSKSRAPVDFGSLRSEPFIIYNKNMGRGFSTVLAEASAHAGFVPQVAHKATSTAMLMSLVAAGEGIAVVSRETALVPRDRVTCCDLADPRITSRVVFAWRQGEDNPSLKHFRAAVREVAGQLE